MSTGSITTKKAQKVIAQAGDYEVLDIDSLHVDPSYQRALNQKLAEEIAAKWDMAVGGAILVSRRSDGTLWIINGQHRAAGAKIAGETEILAQVLDGKTPEEEADFRLRANVLRRDTAGERFRALVRSNDPAALDIVRIVGEFKTRINEVPDQTRGINAVSAVEKMYAIDKGGTLTRTLDVIYDAWGTCEGRYASVQVLKGVQWFLTKHPEEEFHRPRLIDRMREAGVEELERMARSHRANLAGATWINFYRALVEAYNKRLPVERRLLWRTGPSGGPGYSVPNPSAQGEGGDSA